MSSSRLLDLGMRFVTRLRIRRQVICLASWHGMRKAVHDGTFGGCCPFGYMRSGSGVCGRGYVR